MHGLAFGFLAWVVLLLIGVACAKAAGRPRPTIPGPTWEERFDAMMDSVYENGIPYPPDDDETIQ